MVSALAAGLALVALTLAPAAHAVSGPVCKGSGEIIFEERFEGNNAWQPTPITGTSFPLWAPISDLATWSSTFSTTLPAPTQEYAGFQLWHRDVTSSYARVPTDSYNGFAMVSPYHWFNQFPSASGSDFQFQATLTSAPVDVTSVCESTAIYLEADTYSSVCSNCHMRVEWYDETQTVVKSDYFVSASRNGGSRNVQEFFFVPTGATSFRIILQSESSSSSDRNSYLAIDNIVIRAGIPDDSLDICSPAAADPELAVWRGGDGEFHNASHWCFGRLPRQRRTLINCTGLEQCLVRVDHAELVSELQATDSVVLTLFAELRTYRPSTVGTLLLQASNPRFFAGTSLVVARRASLRYGAFLGDLVVHGSLDTFSPLSYQDFSFEAGSTVKLLPTEPTTYHFSQRSYNDLELYSATLYANNLSTLIFDNIYSSDSFSTFDMVADGARIELHGDAPIYVDQGLILANGSTLISYGPSVRLTGGHLLCSDATLTANQSTNFFFGPSTGFLSPTCRVEANVSFVGYSGDLIVQSSVFEPERILVTGGSHMLDASANPSRLNNLEMTGGILTFDSSVDLSSLRNISALGGSLYINQPLDLDLLTLCYRGSTNCDVRLGNDMQVDVFIWNGGYLNAQRNDYTLKVRSTLTPQSTATKYIRALSLELPDSTTTTFSEGATFDVADGSRVVVPSNATLSVTMRNQVFFTSDGSITFPSSFLINYGRVEFTPQYKQSYLSFYGGFHSTGSGSLIVNGGTLRLYGAVELDSAVFVAEEATLSFESWSYCSSADCGYLKYLTSNSTINGSGIININDNLPIDVASSYFSPNLQLNIQSGGLNFRLRRETAFTEDIILSSGTIVFEGADVTIRYLELNGGRVTFRNNAHIEGLIHQNGYLEPQKNLSITDARWLGGYWEGVRTNSVIVGNATLCGSSTHYLTNLRFEINDLADWAGSGGIYLQGNAQMHIAESAQMTVRNGGLTLSGSSRTIGFVNDGTVYISPAELEGATVTFSCGVLSRGDIGLYGGTWAVSSLLLEGNLGTATGAVLRVQGAWHWSKSSRVLGITGQGLGDIYLLSNGNINSQAVRARSITVSAGVVVANGVSRFEAVEAAITSGYLSLLTEAGVASIQSLSISGSAVVRITEALDLDTLTLQDSADLMVEQSLRVGSDFSWVSGDIMGTGVVEALGTVILSGSSYTLSGVQLNANAGFRVTSSGSLSLTNAARLNTAAGSSSSMATNSFSVSGSGSWYHLGSLDLGVAQYSGSDSISINTNLVVAGSVHVTSGTLVMSGFTSISGAITVEEDAELRATNDISFLPSSSVEGSGDVVFTGSSVDAVVSARVFSVANLKVQSSAKASVSFDGDIAFQEVAVENSAYLTVEVDSLTTSHLSISSGYAQLYVKNFTTTRATIANNGHLQLYGEGHILSDLDYQSGYIEGEQGLLTVYDPMVQLTSTSSSYYLRRALRTTGTWIISTDNVYVEGDTSWVSEGTVIIDHDANVRISGAGYIANNGMLRVSSSTCVDVTLPFVTMGPDAAMLLACGTVAVGRLTTSPTCNITVLSGATLAVLDDATIESPLMGGGDLEVRSGTTTLREGVAHQIERMRTTSSNAVLDIQDTDSLEGLRELVATNGAIQVHGTTPLQLRQATVFSGTLSFAVPFNTSSLIVRGGGVVRLAHVSAQANQITWSSGTISGHGDVSLEVANGVSLNTTSSHYLRGVRLIVHGLVDVDADDNELNLYIYTDAIFYAHGGLFVESGFSVSTENANAFVVNKSIEFNPVDTRSIMRFYCPTVLGPDTQVTLYGDWVIVGALIVGENTVFNVQETALLNITNRVQADASVVFNGHGVVFSGSGDFQLPTGSLINTTNLYIDKTNGDTVLIGDNVRSRVILRQGRALLLPEFLAHEDAEFVYDQDSYYAYYYLGGPARVDRDFELQGNDRLYALFPVEFTKDFSGHGGQLWMQGSGSLTFNNLRSWSTGSFEIYGPGRATVNGLLDVRGSTLDLEYSQYAAQLVTYGTTIFEGSLALDTYRHYINYGTLLLSDDTNIGLDNMMNFGNITVTGGEMQVNSFFNGGSLTFENDGSLYLMSSAVGCEEPCDLWSNVSLRLGSDALIYNSTAGVYHLPFADQSVTHYKYISFSSTLEILASQDPNAVLCIDDLYFGAYWGNTLRTAMPVYVHRALTYRSSASYYFQLLGVNATVYSPADNVVINSQSTGFLTVIDQENDTCADYGSCASCAARPECGWDTFSNICRSGSVEGPAEGVACGWTYSDSECPLACSAHTSMGDCTTADAACMWCEIDDTCQDRHVSACSSGANLVWTGAAGNTDFENPENWSPQEVPGANHDLLINANQPITISTDSSSTPLQLRSIQVVGHHGQISFNLYRSLVISGNAHFGSNVRVYMSNYGALDVDGKTTILGELQGYANFGGAGTDAYVHTVSDATAAFTLDANKVVHVNSSAVWRGNYGSHSIAAGAELRFTGASHSFVAGHSFNGDGSVVFEGAVTISLPADTHSISFSSTVVFLKDVLIHQGLLSLDSRTAASHVNGNITLATRAAWLRLRYSNHILARGISGDGIVRVENAANITIGSGLSFGVSLLHVDDSNSHVTLDAVQLAGVSEIRTTSSGTIEVRSQAEPYELRHIDVSGVMIFNSPVVITERFLLSSGTITGNGDVTVRARDVRLSTATFSAGSNGVRQVVFETPVDWHNSGLYLYSTNATFMSEVEMTTPTLCVDADSAMFFLAKARVQDYMATSSSSSCRQGKVVFEDEVLFDYPSTMYMNLQVEINGHATLVTGTLQTSHFTLHGQLEIGEEATLYVAEGATFASSSDVIGKGRLYLAGDTELHGNVSVRALHFVDPVRAHSGSVIKTETLTSDMSSGETAYFEGILQVDYLYFYSYGDIYFDQSTLDWKALSLSYYVHLHVPGAITIHDQLAWNGGTIDMEGTGSVEVLGSVEVTSYRALYIRGGNMTYHGAVVYDTSYTTYLYDEAWLHIAEGATMSCTVSCSFSSGDLRISGDWSVANTGSFSVSSNVTLESTGSIYASNAQVTFYDRFIADGRMTTDRNGQLNFAGIQEVTLNPSSRVDGQVSVVASYSYSDVQANVTFNTTNLSFDSFTCSGSSSVRYPRYIHFPNMASNHLREVSLTGGSCALELPANTAIAIEKADVRNGLLSVPATTVATITELYLYNQLVGSGRIVTEQLVVLGYSITLEGLSVEARRVNISASYVYMRGGARLQVQDFAIWTGTSAYLYMYDSSLFHVRSGATFAVYSDLSANRQSGDPRLVFDGEVIVYNRYSISAFTYVTNQVTIVAGAYLSLGQSQISGQIVAADPSLSTWRCSSTCTVTALGQLKSGTVTVSGTLTAYARSLSLHTVSITGTLHVLRPVADDNTTGTPTIANSITLQSSGRLELDTDVTVPRLSQQSTSTYVALQYRTQLFVPIRYDFQSGRVTGTGNARVLSAAKTIFRSGSSKYIQNVAFTAQGTSTWTQGYLYLQSGGTLTVPSGSTFVATSDSSMSGSGSFVVQGTLSVENCIASAVFDVPMNISGTITTAGSIAFRGDTTVAASGIIQMTSVASYVQAASNQLILQDAASIRGQGRVEVSSGLLVLASGVLNVPLDLTSSSARVEVLEGGNATLAKVFNFEAGFLQGKGLLYAANIVHWESGTINSVLVIQRSMLLDSANQKTVSNYGALSVDDGATLQLSAGTLYLYYGKVVVQNGGTFVVDPVGATSISQYSSGSLFNAGTLAIYASSDVFSLAGLRNAGYLYIMRGTTQLASGTIFESSSEVRGNGNLTTSSDVQLNGLMYLGAPGGFYCENCNLYTTTYGIITGQFYANEPYFGRNNDNCETSWASSRGVLSQPCLQASLRLHGNAYVTCSSRSRSCHIDQGMSVTIEGTMHTTGGRFAVDSPVRVTGNLLTNNTRFERYYSSSSTIDVEHDLCIGGSDNMQYFYLPVHIAGGTVRVFNATRFSCLSQDGGRLHLVGASVDVTYDGACSAYVNEGGEISGFGQIEADLLSCRSCLLNAADGGIAVQGDADLLGATLVTRLAPQQARNMFNVSGHLTINSTRVHAVVVDDSTLPLAWQANAVPFVFYNDNSGAFDLDADVFATVGTNEAVAVLNPTTSSVQTQLTYAEVTVRY